jgi:Family of unknown function (DUF6444)
VRRSRSFGRVERLTARPDMLEAENAQLRAANAELKRRLGMNSRNSVKPPSTDSLNYLAWQKNFPRSVRDRAPGLLVEVMRRKAESAGGDRLYEFNTTTTALSQTCLCGNRTKKPLSQRVHPLRVRHHRRSAPVFGLPRTARPPGGAGFRPTGPAGSQPWLAAPSRR